MPLDWYFRLVRATPEERGNWELTGEGHRIRWTALYEDLNLEGLIAGCSSGKSQRSFKRWLEAERPGRSVLLF